MKECKLKLIVKLETTVYWHKNYSAFSKQKKVTLLKRQSVGTLKDIMDDIELDVMSMVDFDDLKDGTYELITCNESADWETGIIDEWDYKLVPYEQNT